MKKVNNALKDYKIKRLEKELVGLEDGFLKANIEFELFLLTGRWPEKKED